MTATTATLSIEEKINSKINCFDEKEQLKLFFVTRNKGIKQL